MKNNFETANLSLIIKWLEDQIDKIPYHMDSSGKHYELSKELYDMVFSDECSLTLLNRFPDLEDYYFDQDRDYYGDVLDFLTALKDYYKHEYESKKCESNEIGILTRFEDYE